MKVKELLEIEEKRNNENKFRIYLNKEGNFYRSYNWSAWLIKTYVCTEEFQKERGDEKMLNVTHYKTNKNEYFFVGFPLQSVSKFIPNYDSSKSGEDGMLIIDIDKSNNDTIELMEKNYNEWVGLIPISERKKSNKDIKKVNEQASALGRSGLFSIVSKILSYPTEQKTLLENFEFICDIKREIINLL